MPRRRPPVQEAKEAEESNPSSEMHGLNPERVGGHTGFTSSPPWAPEKPGGGRSLSGIAGRMLSMPQEPRLKARDRGFARSHSRATLAAAALRGEATAMRTPTFLRLRTLGPRPLLSGQAALGLRHNPAGSLRP